MFRFKLNLDKLVSTTNFPQLGFYEIINIENCSLANIVSISMLHIQYQNGTPILTGVATYEDESTEQLIKTGSQDILSLSDTEDYIIFDADLPENPLLLQTIFYYIGNGVLEVLQREDAYEVPMILYLQNSENDNLNKDLEVTGLMNGVFNTAIGFKNIDIDVTKYNMHYNYVYVPKFERYYYIDSIELISADYTRLHLKEDVLMSWKDLIKQQKAFVSRYENSTDKSLVDIRLPLQDKLSVAEMSITDTPSAESFVNCELDFDVLDPNSKNVMIVSQSTEVSDVNDLVITAPTGSGLPDIRSRFNDKEYIRFITLSNLGTFTKAYRSDDAVSSFFYSVLWLPFDATTLFNLQMGSAIFVRDKFINDVGDYVDYNSSDTPLRCYYPDSTSPGYGAKGECPYIIIKDFTITGYNEFWNREPYSNYEVFVPFVGWVKVDSNKILNNRILIYYSMDLTTGLATAFIYNYTEKYVIWSGTCTLGIKFDLTTTNMMENIRQKQNNDLNMILGIMSSAVAVGIGVLTENPIAISGGILSASKTIASNVNANNMIFERAQTTTGSSDGSLHMNKDVKVRRTYHVPVYIDSATYKHLQGLPYNSYVSSLSLLNGYVEIGEIHFDPKGNKIYQNEIVEIVELLQRGCIF